MVAITISRNACKCTAIYCITIYTTIRIWYEVLGFHGDYFNDPFVCGASDSA
ncbi:hypothetical protein BMETH_1328_0 [methanotrophic bacterial endosymbiont of Bathymodiolus sp.]|nr:hypothetical protein BMETH_1328_0 [methanotrophic bacterial endosymbiont of Bathymodiolus sp.]